MRGSRRHKGLGSSLAIHTQQAAKAARDIEHAAALLTNKARQGRCQAATMAYADMQRAIGHFEAHTAAGAKKAWLPQTAIVDAAFEYNEHCVREGTLAGHRRGRR